MDTRRTWDTLIQHGIPPNEGVLRFTGGIGPLLEAMDTSVLKRQVKEGRAAVDKLVVAQYGGGKTHFLRATQELASLQGFITSYVAIAGVADYSNWMMLCRAILNKIQYGSTEGVIPILEDALERKRARFMDAGMPDPDAGLDQWRSRHVRFGINWPHPSFGEVLYKTLTGLKNDDGDTLAAAKQWLGCQDITPTTRKILGVPSISGAAKNEHGRNLLLSWLFLFDHVGYPGTCILLDEAEKAFSARGKAQIAAVTVLRSLCDAFAANEGRACLVLTAITQDARDEAFDRYVAVRGRYESIGSSFSPEFPLAPSVDLYRSDGRPEEAMLEIGERLLDMALEIHGPMLDEAVQRENARALAQYSLTRTGLEISHRRLFVRTLCTLLERDALARSSQPWSPDEMSGEFGRVYESIIETDGAEDEP